MPCIAMHCNVCMYTPTQYTYNYIDIYIYDNIHTLHYIALHCITLHCITLHCITLLYITLHYITLHYITYIHCMRV